MYLHRFEDGAIWQVDSEPTSQDLECIKDGLLQVFRVREGRYQELMPNGKWKEVETVRQPD